MRAIILLLSACLASVLPLHAQPPCLDEELSLIVEIRTDQYANETAWSVADAAGNVYAEVGFNTYANNTLYQTQVCIPENTCIFFSIRDSYGDGIFNPGFYRLILEGDTLAMGNDFGSYDSFNFNCQPGEVCETAIPVQAPGQYETLFDDTWYWFVPDSTGIYTITTCGLNDCDTKIWVYSTCEGISIFENNQGTLFYNDEGKDCAPQAELSTHFVAGSSYYIRMGDNMDACPDSIPIVWEIYYEGPVIGCTDPNSCNYDPLAAIDDGSCLPQMHPDCPDGPDLLMRQDVLVNSLQLTTINSTDACLINEGCLRGYGLRNIIRFTTWIDNIGELDYYIGTPSATNNQFTWDNCHSHWHYDSYAEYLLFRDDGHEIPIGFKNGFCVLDLGCSTGTAKFGCGNMGISPGCFDVYSASLECQWIDVTDVPDGRYVFVSRVNWRNAPDKLGRLEKDTLNNWAQACIILDRSSGTLQMTVDPDCEPYTDCAGTPYGAAQEDCTGECGGSVLRGDIDANGAQEIVDAQEYVMHILADDIEPTPCNDLNADGRISVYDAALLASCVNYGVAHWHPDVGSHDHCRFPAGVLNPGDTTTLSIIAADFEEGYIDIGILNPTTRINAYEFKVSGLQIMRVENLADPDIYPIMPSGGLDHVIGISYQDSSLFKANEVQPLCRIYYSELTDNFVCISEIIDIVNYHHEQTVAQIGDACVEYVPVNSLTNPLFEALQPKLFPNPFSQQARLVFQNPQGDVYRLEVLGADGRRWRAYEGITGEEVLIDGKGMPEGMYWYRLIGSQGYVSGKMSLQRP
jgi:hypothetical protein